MMMSMQSCSISPEARQFFARRHEKLRNQLAQELAKSVPDEERMFMFRLEMSVIESRAAWLRTEAQV